MRPTRGRNGWRAVWEVDAEGVYRVQGHSSDCPVCGQPGGFHSDMPMFGLLRPRQGVMRFRGHAKAGAEVPRELVKAHGWQDEEAPEWRLPVRFL